MLINTSGLAKRTANPIDFMPKYLRESNPVIVEKSPEQQAREWADFKARYQAAQQIGTAHAA